ncbi:TPA_asm: coat protein [ssRNA phage Esthiorhiza.2_11]|uniref:Coat protein n=2 Tax=Leviviricetes TaxID=2842243 RepID=A0A8S5L2L9_9VIRU|nr:coat protein [ssRNA phage Esthiorhiza.2_11]QDH87431.1 MAG: hypothetical protein H2RhizoLitter491228_000002 [Leviviridae sp.]DAD51739.1 TPA_asm: coat protein [ssRNA phage Esthiorhiza.2_11]
MAYSDPQSVTIGTAQSLPRTGSGLGTGSFTKADGNVGLVVNHSKSGKGRYRRQVRVNLSKIAADPFIAGKSNGVSASVYLVIDVPSQGFTVAEQTDLLTSLTTWLTASTNANAIKFIGGES